MWRLFLFDYRNVPIAWDFILFFALWDSILNAHSCDNWLKLGVNCIAFENFTASIRDLMVAIWVYWQSKQWLSSIPAITTKRGITSRLIEHNNRPCHMRLKLQVLSWDRHTNVADLKPLMGKHLCILVSGNVKPLFRFSFHKKPRTSMFFSLTTWSVYLFTLL
jgi:hypothetical protein